MARHIDVDAIWEAMAPPGPGPTLKIMGETIELPADKPVAFVLLEHQIRQGGLAEYPTVVRVLGQVVGPAVVGRWIEKNLGKEKLTTAVMLIGTAWIPEKDDDSAGEARPPETGERSSTTSATDGGSSSPTSTASTGATT